MKQSVRKRMSITKLSLARIRYIREHYFQFISENMKQRKDITRTDAMHKDTMVVEVGIEVLFKAICNAMEVSPEEADILAIEEYSMKTTVPDKFATELANFVELEQQAEKRAGVTLEERKRAVEEYRSKRNIEISNEWDEQE